MFNKKNIEKETQSRCYNDGLKHNYMPRYHEIRTIDSKTKKCIDHLLSKTSYDDLPELSNNLQNIGINYIYVYDICTWCGKIIELPNRKENL